MVVTVVEVVVVVVLAVVVAVAVGAKMTRAAICIAITWLLVP